jgi:hypothetical protein
MKPGVENIKSEVRLSLSAPLPKIGIFYQPLVMKILLLLLLLLLIMMMMRRRRRNVKNWCNVDLYGKKTKYSPKTCLGVTLSTTHPTWISS